MRIVSTRRMESLLQLIITWEQLSEKRITQAWVNVRGGLRARVTRHSWLVACDAATSSVEIHKKVSGFRRNQMHVVAPEKASTCRSKGAKEEWIDKVYDYRWRWWKTLSRGRTKQ